MIKSKNLKNFQMPLKARKYILENHSIAKYIEIEKNVYKKIIWLKYLNFYTQFFQNSILKLLIEL